MIAGRQDLNTGIQRTHQYGFKTRPSLLIETALDFLVQMRGFEPRTPWL